MRHGLRSSKPDQFYQLFSCTIQFLRLFSLLFLSTIQECCPSCIKRHGIADFSPVVFASFILGDLQRSISYVASYEMFESVFSQLHFNSVGADER
ncbi:unnamed protein product [Cuscuta europaea]|uniref:Uncharacterized protein n=1 Tax=Cuscuta europaea TaxID=41803 RepID=A0A9P1EB05_CUSEU|nr:unnamed protein product [Cuscuta europaea]